MLSAWLVLVLYLYNTYWEMSLLGTTCTCLQSPRPSMSGRFCRRVYMNALWRYHSNQVGTLSRNPRLYKSKESHSFYTKMPFHCRSCISKHTSRIFFLFLRKSQRHKKIHIWETYLDLYISLLHLLCVCSCELQFHLKKERKYRSSTSSSLSSSLPSLHCSRGQDFN